MTQTTPRCVEACRAEPRSTRRPPPRDRTAETERHAADRAAGKRASSSRPMRWRAGQMERERRASERARPTISLTEDARGARCRVTPRKSRACVFGLLLQFSWECGHAREHAHTGTRQQRGVGFVPVGVFVFSRQCYYNAGFTWEHANTAQLAAKTHTRRHPSSEERNERRFC